LELTTPDSSAELIPDKSLSSQQKTIAKRSFEASFTRVTGSFSSPSPPPEILKAYDIVEPGLAARIFDLTEKQAKHRMELEKAVVFGDGKRSWTGLILAFITTCLFLGCGTYLISQGFEQTGGLIVGVNLVALVGAFIYGTNSRMQERSEKLRTLIGKDLDNKQE